MPFFAIVKSIPKAAVKQLFSNTYLVQPIAKMSTNIPPFKHLAVTSPKEFVFHVELNRPEKVNAINYTLFSEIKQCFEFLSESEDCRVAVLSGAGKLFCAGIDLQDFSQNLLPQISQVEDVARRAKGFLKLIRYFQQTMSSLEYCKKPVIAAVHGACIGAGLDLISAADIRYCTKDAYFQIKEVDIGMAADIGSLQRVPKILGSDSFVREITYTARKVPAEEALNQGLISKVFDNKDELLQGALNLAEDISKKSPVAVQTSKANLIYSRDHTVEEGSNHIALLNQLMMQSEDLLNATMGQFTKDPNVRFSKL